MLQYNQWKASYENQVKFVCQYNQIWKMFRTSYRTRFIESFD
jgi:hypothetical protein